MSKERIKEKKQEKVKQVSFIVTKDCQLACKYCYLVGKTSYEKMPFEVAKKTIDYILSQKIKDDSVVWDFMGGEPFIEIDLIDHICEYIKEELFRRNHPWFNSYMFNITTNGINYHQKKVQNFIVKNHCHLNISITIDGTALKHNLNRIYKESGRGCYEDVVKNIPLWINQFPNVGTKVTVSSEDIPYIKESVLHLYGLGIKKVNINCVFENVWKNGDDVLLEEQLIALADEIIDKKYYEDFQCSFFNENIGGPLDCKLDNQNWCGAGKMLAVDAKGMFYPCARFAKYSLRNKKARIIGDINNGIDKNKLRPFLSLQRVVQSKLECINCSVACGCGWCQAENYDTADTDTIYQRSTAICKMHKARVHANNYYWNRLYRKLNTETKT